MALEGSQVVVLVYRVSQREPPPELCGVFEEALNLQCDFSSHSEYVGLLRKEKSSRRSNLNFVAFKSEKQLQSQWSKRRLVIL